VFKMDPPINEKQVQQLGLAVFLLYKLRPIDVSDAVSGDRLPIRLFLSNYNLSPTMRSVEDLFSVKYYLNIIIMDVDDNTYFKQQVYIYIYIYIYIYMCVCVCVCVCVCCDMHCRLYAWA